MKLFKKSAMSLAMSVAIVGGMTAMQQASALEQTPPYVVTTDANGSQTVTPTGNPYVSVNGTGQALVFPYYTVRDGYKSFFNVTNTSNRTVAYKVRYREGLNSRDALDFTVVLSPYDVFNGWVEEGADGPVFKTGDNSCMIGAPSAHNRATGSSGSGQPMLKIGYSYQPSGVSNATAFTDQGDQTIDRTREGYLEFIPMGVASSEATTNIVATNALHKDNGFPKDCDALDDAFKAPGGPLGYPLTGDTIGSGNPTAANHLVAMPTGFNPLKGNFSIINGDTGIGAGNTAVHIADFMNPAVGSLVTAQNFPYFLEPTFASRDGIWTTSGLDEVNTALMTASIANEWASNGNTGAETDWVINFPTKSFFVDNEDKSGNPTTTNVQAAVNKWRIGSAALVNTMAGFSDINADGSATKLSMLNFNREEGYKTADPGVVQPSPAPIIPADDINIYRETNVITFSENGNGLASAQALPADPSGGLDAKGGWTSIGFANGPLPAVGFAFKLRNQGDTGKAYGQIMDHAYSDSIIPTPTD